jgi:deoxyribodipyrimidine photo-lyase
MGDAYAARRNYDAGPDAHTAVSGLSPWLRHRLLTEDEVIAAAGNAHGARRAEKFVQEVLWRTYWKGWLEQHPAAWHDYRDAVAEELPRAAGDVAAVTAGRTGIAFMDARARELVETGYLHNHARMWFASIWCFTLRLPWQLGADFFLRHLLDGDAASNTLSWRWVAGLQTRGKHYVARADNIARYTGGRFNPAGELNESPLPLPPGPPEPRIALPNPPPPPLGRVALLLHDDDLLPETLPLGGADVVAIGGIAVPEARSPAGCAPLAAAWARGALADGLDRAALHFGVPAAPVADIAAWAEAAGCATVVTPYAPVGWTADWLAAAEEEMAARGITLHRILRPWDAERWPHAKGGFFGFWREVNR